MARLRLVFALLAAAILAATALLAERALRAGAVERAARHETLAERLFDEMERSLSAFLSREEERPFGHYGFRWAPGGAEGEAALVRSPLSRLAEDREAPFVVGWFQIDPDGSVRSPLLPRAEDPASGPPPGAAERELAERVRAIVEAALAARGGRSAELGALADALPRAKAAPHAAPPPRAAASPPAQASPRAGAKAEELREDAAGRAFAEGTTSSRAAPQAPEAEADSFAAGEPLPRPAAAQAAKKDAPAPAPEAASAYDLLQSLNRAGLERQARERKVLIAEAPPAPARPPSAEAPAGTPARAPRDERRVTVDPFVGRLAGGHLLLVRTVLVGDRGYRQGIVLDASRLARFLRDAALGALALPGARLAFAPGGSFEVGALGGDAFSFSHGFAEPFDALSLELDLAPLPGQPGEGAVLALAALLVLAAGAGLFALYRMVTVRLAFAQRRSNFAAAVSHELKTPLTAIRMYVEMLRDGLVPTEEKRREYYATLGSESERLSRLIDNVLEFSRLERGTRRLELHAAPLGPALLELAELLRPHAERQGFRFEIDAPAGLPPVRFERDALAQILFNLVENALKYARGAADRTLELRCRAEGAGVLLSVRDRGPGVPEKRLARVFEPFYRGEDELTRETQGSGIGLALVHGLAERMGAGVSARNAPGGGFEVTLRFAPA
jgi:signal transduction histidine kinase